MTDVFKKHQRRIARATLKMSDEGAQIMGGMTKTEAREFLASEADKHCGPGFGRRIRERETP